MNRRLLTHRRTFAFRAEAAYRMTTDSAQDVLPAPSVPRTSALGQGPADHDPLDLGGALEDRVDLGVPVPLLHREVLDVAVASQDLDGLLGDPHGPLAGLELAHGALGRPELRPVAGHPRRAP